MGLLLVRAPGGLLEEAWANVSLRCLGTNVDFSITTVFEPVPAWPALNQSSSISQSVRGTRRKPACFSATSSSGGKNTPMSAQSELSMLDDQCHLPETR